MLTDPTCLELQQIIATQNLQAVFQPIYDTNKSCIIGYEALIRGPANSQLHSPMALFQTAGKCNQLAALENACRHESCKAFKALNLPGKLFLNVSPMTLTDPQQNEEDAMLLVQQYGINADQVVIELSEQYPLDDYELIRNASNHYRSLGFEIAIDDLGAGYAGLRIWSELRPDYVKIDRHFIENIHEDSVKWEFVRSIYELAKNAGTKVIAEGIEVEAELNTLTAIGIDLAQGYYLARPNARPSIQVPNHLVKTATSKNYSGLRPNPSVKELVQPWPVINPEKPLDEVADIFQKNPKLSSIAVVKDDIPYGLVSRTAILELLSLRYSRDLYGRHPVAQHMHIESVIFDQNTTLAEASKLITDNPERDLNLDFIIAKEGKFLGVGRIKQLLRRITELQLRSARYCNPLTLLPGNVPIYEVVDSLLKQDQAFHYAYIDLNFFKPFNDHFGYNKGDEVLSRLAEILSRHANAEQDFVGHIGGDDFIIAFTSSDWKQRCDDIISSFSQQVQQWYQPGDLTQQGIWGFDRAGKKQFFPILSLAIGVIQADPKQCKSHHEVAALASEAKHRAKSIQGNNIYIAA